MTFRQIEIHTTKNLYMRSPCAYSMSYSKLWRGLENIQKACVHPTASTEWARRAHLVLVSLAFIHHG